MPSKQSGTSGGGDRAWLLLGPEEGEKAAFVSSLIDAAAKREGGRPEVLRFYPSEGDLRGFLEGLQTGDLFAQHRVAQITDIDQLGKADVDRLCAYLSSPASDVTVLLLSSSSYLGARDAASRAQKLVPEAQRKVFWELFQGQKMGWVVKFFSGRSMRIDKAAAEYLLDVVESNTRDLKAECEKLALFQGKGATIALDTVEQFVFHSKEENAFTLFDRLAERTLEASLEVLHKILLSPPFEGIAVLGGLLLQWRRLLELELLREEGLSFEAAVERAGIRGKRNQQSFRSALKSYSLEEVRAVIALTADYHASLRSYRSELQGLLLSQYLYYVAVRGGRAPARAPRWPPP
jgi:DNA polymerase III subunit delta